MAICSNTCTVVTQFFVDEKCHHISEHVALTQEHYLEETFKMRNLLEEFEIQYGGRFPTILGVREHVFTGR